MGPIPLALVVNEVADFREAQQVHTRIDAVCRRFLGLSLPMAGWIAHDPGVAQAVRARCPLILRTPHSPAALAVSRLGAALVRHFGLTVAAASSHEPGALQRLSHWLTHFSAR